MLNRIAFLTMLPLAPASTASAGLAQNAPACRSTVSGDLRMHTLTSNIFGNTRTVRVLVPPGYGAPENAVRYPVLYMLDGQNLFDAGLSGVSQAEWGMDETVNRLIREKKIPPIIVVGIDHAGKERGHEYLPYRDFIQEASSREPIGKQLPDFLTNEVMPLVDVLTELFRVTLTPASAARRTALSPRCTQCWPNRITSVSDSSRARRSGSGWVSWCGTRAH